MKASTSTQLEGLRLVTIDISRDATGLSAQLCSLHLNYSESIETLSQGLTKVAEECRSFLTPYPLNEILRKLNIELRSSKRGGIWVLKMLPSSR